MSSKIAKRSDWEVQELPKERTIIQLNRKFSNRDMMKIKKGRIPESQDDKWFIFYENGSLYFHRSWSGFCIYIVKIEEKADEHMVLEVLANRNKEQYMNDNDEIDKGILNNLIDGLVY